MARRDPACVTFISNINVYLQYIYTLYVYYIKSLRKRNGIPYPPTPTLTHTHTHTHPHTHKTLYPLSFRYFLYSSPLALFNPIMSSPYVVSKSVRSLSHLFTKIRDKNTSRVEFCRFCNRLMTILWYVPCKLFPIDMDNKLCIAVKKA